MERSDSYEVEIDKSSVLVDEAEVKSKKASASKSKTDDKSKKAATKVSASKSKTDDKSKKATTKASATKSKTDDKSKKATTKASASKSKTVKAKTTAKKTVGKKTYKNLVIVESPAKAKTIKKYLGSGYEVIASMGHVRDLPKSTMGVDLENRNFEPHYINMRDKSKVIKELKSAAKGVENIFLATDPDREGEAISWHLAHLLNMDLAQPNRVVFNEITKTAVKNGIAHPRTVNQDLVDAQQARRILDRIVGYKLSPFLWKKVRKGLSAGRVQSVTVRMIVDRELEIREFVEEEYWNLQANLIAPSSKRAFIAKFYGDPKKRELKTGEETVEIVNDLENKEFVVDKVKLGTRQKSPAPPFTTSTMQQEASRKLGFQARRTMTAAQQLYEGVTIPKLGAVGLITYMRTDSLRVSDEAYFSATAYIEGKYGGDYLPPKRRFYKSKSNAQDGHEAVRPTMPELHPDDIKASLTTDQYKLYRLVWMRFIASQMASAVYDTVSAVIMADKYRFNASGFSVKFDGFTVLYEEGKDEVEESAKMLPKLEEGGLLKLKKLEPSQHFTQPPPRYTEASLIKTLEENGIGRPSTYAPTISTITARGYVEREAKTLKPTVLGEITTGLMKERFPNVVDAEFTAKMEQDLDKIEDGDVKWQETLEEFYEPFEKTLEEAEKAMEGVHLKVPDEETDEICDVCGKPMVIKMGRFGKFIACTGFPECKNTKKIVKQADGFCPICDSQLLTKKTKKGRLFYGCSAYPTCDFASWDAPTKSACPKCGKTLFKKGGKDGKLTCLNPPCGYTKEKE